jgi:mRNA interferase MazF
VIGQECVLPLADLRQQVALDPAIGSEQGKTRPAVIVSNNGANDSAMRRGRAVVTVVPVTTNVRSIHPFQVLITARDSGLPMDAKPH